MSNTKENLKKRIFNISCQIIIIISLICALFYWLPSLDYRIAIAIHSNSVTKAISDIYDNIFFSFFSFLISMFSFIYAALILCKRNRKSTADKKIHYICFDKLNCIYHTFHYIKGTILRIYLRYMMNVKNKGIKAADVNGDGDVNVTDIAKIAAHVKGIKAIG